MKRINLKGAGSVVLGHARRLQLSLKPRQMSPLAAMLLAGLCALALATGLFALHALFGPSGVDDGAAAPEWKPPTLAIVPLDPPKPADADAESLSRPIFIKSRKPPPKAAITPSATSESAAPGTVSVTAIVRNKKAAQAFFVSSDAPEGAWKKIGDTVESWTVTAITPKEVVLQSGGQTTKVKLYADVPAPAEGAATTPAAPAQPQPQGEPSTAAPADADAPPGPDLQK